MPSTRTTTTGSGASWRYTSGQPDGLNDPSSGTWRTGPPFIWSTGGTTITANSNPAGIGMDIVLDYLCEEAGWSIAQFNAPGFIGRPEVWPRMEDAIAWLRANRGATNDPPIVMGPSGGFVNANSYARLYEITALIGLLPVVDATSCYVNNDFGFRHLIETTYGITYPTPIPDGFDPWRDREMWPVDDLRGKYQCWYSGNDPLYVGSQMGYGQFMGGEYHNVGGYGHAGVIDLSNGGFDATDPAKHIDLARMAEFIEERVALL